MNWSLDNAAQSGLAIFGAIVVLAILATIFGAPATPGVISSASGGIAKLIAGAVDPQGTAATNSNPAANAQTTPSIQTPTSLLPGLLGT
jgi:hypothetical protein